MNSIARLKSIATQALKAFKNEYHKELKELPSSYVFKSIDYRATDLFSIHIGHSVADNDKCHYLRDIPDYFEFELEDYKCSYPTFKHCIAPCGVKLASYQNLSCIDSKEMIDRTSDVFSGWMSRIPGIYSWGIAFDNDRPNSSVEKFGYYKPIFKFMVSGEAESLEYLPDYMGFVPIFKQTMQDGNLLFAKELYHPQECKQPYCLMKDSMSVENNSHGLRYWTTVGNSFPGKVDDLFGAREGGTISTLVKTEDGQKKLLSVGHAFVEPHKSDYQRHIWVRNKELQHEIDPFLHPTPAQLDPMIGSLIGKCSFAANTKELDYSLIDWHTPDIEKVFDGCVKRFKDYEKNIEMEQMSNQQEHYRLATGGETKKLTLVAFDRQIDFGSYKMNNLLRFKSNRYVKPGNSGSCSYPFDDENKMVGYLIGGDTSFLTAYVCDAKRLFEQTGLSLYTD